MRRLLVMSIAFVSFQFVGPVCALEQFNTEAAAQQHSPTDTVVSVNIPSMIWHYKGQRYYGNTKHGAYVRAAAAAKSVLAKSNSA